MPAVFLLYPAQELESTLGSKYFYRQSIYRLSDEGAISSYSVDGVLRFSAEEVQNAVASRLAEKIRSRFPPHILKSLRIRCEPVETKTMAVYIPGRDLAVSVNTDTETEEELLTKLELIREEVISVPDIPVHPPGTHHPPHHGPEPHHPPHPGPEEHHRHVLEALRRIEEGLRRIEEKLR